MVVTGLSNCPMYSATMKGPKILAGFKQEPVTGPIDSTHTNRANPMQAPKMSLGVCLSTAEAIIMYINKAVPIASAKKPTVWSYSTANHGNPVIVLACAY